MNRALPTKPSGPLAALAACILVVSCGRENAYVPPPSLPVDVQRPLVQPLTVYEQYTGRTEPFKRYEVRTRVTGFIVDKDFEDGSFVEEGKVLFGIERVQFEAAVTKAKGDLEKANADLRLAQTNYEKREAASESGAVSKIDVAAALAEQEVAAANVKIAEAVLEDAEQNLDYCDIRSKISGRVSRPLVDRGNLVNGQEATLLATVVQDDPIYVTVELSQREILGFLDKRSGTADPAVNREAMDKKLKLLRADGSPYALDGHFHSLDNEINPETGTIELTSEFPNPDGLLAAGLSVRLRIPLELESAVIVPAAAIQRDLLGTYVFVLGEDSTARRRTVILSRFSLGELALIDEGLAEGDRVIVSNLQRVRAGAQVSPEEVAPPVLDGPGGGGSGGAPIPPEQPAPSSTTPDEPDPSSASVPDKNPTPGHPGV